MLEIQILPRKIVKCVNEKRRIYKKVDDSKTIDAHKVGSLFTVGPQKGKTVYRITRIDDTGMWGEKLSLNNLFVR